MIHVQLYICIYIIYSAFTCNLHAQKKRHYTPKTPPSTLHASDRICTLLLRSQAAVTLLLHSKFIPQPSQTAGGYPDSRGKKSLRDRSRIKKLAQVSAKFLKSLWLWTQISLETALLQFFYHCTQVRLDESERQRSAASVVRANLDVVARYPSHFVPGSMLKHFVAFFQPDSHYLLQVSKPYFSLFQAV